MDIYRGKTKIGTLIGADPSVRGSVTSGGLNGATEAEAAAYDLARSLIEAGRLVEARSVLEDAGLETLPTGRGPDDRRFDALWFRTEKAPRPAPIQFRAPPSLKAQLEARVDRVARAEDRDDVGLGLVASRDLERYYALLSAELERIDLSVGEAMLLCDVLNGSAQHNNMTPPLAAEVEDAFEDRDAEGRPLLASKWDVDPDRLLGKLRRLGPAATWAVVEAVERWWSGPYRRDDVDRETTLRAVGLIRARREMPVPGQG